MNNTMLGTALDQAIKAVGATPKNRLQKLSLFDCVIALDALPNTPELARVRQRLADRLQNRLDLTWIKKGDIDEVFSVFWALWAYNSLLVKGHYLAAAIERLIASEVGEGGPYRSGTTVSVVANVHIAIFMRLIAKPLPNVEALLDRVIAMQHFQDPKLRPSAFIYLLAKAHDSPALICYVAHHWQQASWQTPLHAAIALTVLKNNLPLGDVQRALVAIVKRQQPSGFWKAEPLVASTHAGARFITTTLIIQAFAEYQRRRLKLPRSRLEQKHHVVARAARRMFNTYTEPLRSTALAAVDHMDRADTNFEITLLPQLFAQALKRPARLAPHHVTMLGLANLYVWIAYTIYDDFLDDEGVPEKLPVANVAMRASLDCFKKVMPEQPTFGQYVGGVFAHMDEANAWEVDHCRFKVNADEVCISELPKYGNRRVLAARSFAHALAPMAILTQGRKSGPNTKVYSIESAFRQYLIARQLNDDMHDWAQDIQAGQASYVVTAILRDMRVRPGTYSLGTLLPTMQRCFRRTTMPKVGQCILHHLDVSRQCFTDSQLLKTTNNIYGLLENLELSVHHSLDIYAKSRALTRIQTDLRKKE